MNQKEIRWKQRFENFEKSYLLLRQSLDIKKPSVVERAGIIQFFEITFELSWKLLKDYLENQNVEAKFPCDVIKEAFHYEIIQNGDAWMAMLGTVHTYDETKAAEIESKIRNAFFPAISNMYRLMKDKT
jgi:nucleotidyltransferase substrate binding protein (TIGR01987 family)